MVFNKTNRALIALPVAVIAFGLFFGLRAALDGPPNTSGLGADESRFAGAIDESGNVDYLAFSNEILSKDVLNSENAAIPFLELMDHDRGLTGSMLATYAKQFGMKKIDRGGPHILGLQRFQSMRESAQVATQHKFALANLWSKETAPLISEWLKINETAMAKAESAAQLPKFFSPFHPNQNSELQIADTFPISDCCAEFAQLFRIRANRSLATGDFMQCQRDLLTIHKLARLAGQTITRSEQRIALTIEKLAHRGEIAMCRNWKWDKQYLRRYLGKISELGNVTNVNRAIDIGERVMILDTVTLFATTDNVSERHALLNRLNVPHGMYWVFRKTGKILDWNETIREINRGYDKIVKAGEIEDYQERIDAITAVAERSRRKAFKSNSVSSVGRLLVAGKKSRGKMLGQEFIHAMFSGIAKLHRDQEKEIVRMNMAKIAIGLEEFFISNGEYPDSISALKGEYLEDLPKDSFQLSPNKDFIYVRQESKKAYMLASAGPVDGKTPVDTELRIDLNKTLNESPSPKASSDGVKSNKAQQSKAQPNKAQSNKSQSPN